MAHPHTYTCTFTTRACASELSGLIIVLIVVHRFTATRATVPLLICVLAFIHLLAAAQLVYNKCRVLNNSVYNKYKCIISISRATRGMPGAAAST